MYLKYTHLENTNIYVSFPAGFYQLAKSGYSKPPAVCCAFLYNFYFYFVILGPGSVFKIMPQLFAGGESFCKLNSFFSWNMEKWGWESLDVSCKNQKRFFGLKQTRTRAASPPPFPPRPPPNLPQHLQEAPVMGRDTSFFTYTVCGWKLWGIEIHDVLFPVRHTLTHWLTDSVYCTHVSSRETTRISHLPPITTLQFSNMNMQVEDFSAEESKQRSYLLFEYL